MSTFLKRGGGGGGGGGSFVCQACATQAPAWAGKCAACGAWNTIIQEAHALARKREGEDEREDGEAGSERTPAQALPTTEIGDASVEYFETGIGELDRVLGGGIVPGGIYLLGGEPGAGKSTLLLQTMGEIAGMELEDSEDHGGPPDEGKVATTLYVSGEESVEQVGARAKRLGFENPKLLILATTELDDVFAAIEEHEPFVIVIDSVQTLQSSSVDSAAGTVTQLRQITAETIAFCKERGVAAFLIGHVTKEGGLAGPKTLEHLVDTVLAFEGDRTHALRMLRGIKNRFGPNEVGLFEMTGDGMHEVKNPSAWLLAERAEGAVGSCVVATAEGTRGMLVEVQALVQAKGNGKRVVSGVEGAKVQMLLAILKNIIPGSADIFVNLAGGARVGNDPGVDLGVAVAIASAALGLPVGRDCIVFGEVGLNGEVRGVSRMDVRMNEAEALGFGRVVTRGEKGRTEEGGGAGGGGGRGKLVGKKRAAAVSVGVGRRGAQIVYVKSVVEAIAAALGCKAGDIRPGGPGGVGGMLEGGGGGGGGSGGGGGEGGKNVRVKPKLASLRGGKP